MGLDAGTKTYKGLGDSEGEGRPKYERERIQKEQQTEKD